MRINQLSYALMALFRRPVPEVFREFIARPCGCSEDWRWVGYDTSWVEIDGRRMQSVAGGSHWGGGCSISAQDQALIGQMLLNQGGSRDGRRVLSQAWARADARTVRVGAVLRLSNLAQPPGPDFFQSAGIELFRRGRACLPAMPR